MSSGVWTILNGSNSSDQAPGASHGAPGLTINNTFGGQWRRPLSILDERLVQLSGTLSF